MSSTGTSFLKVTESEALIESSFRRLLASIESEREKIRSTWQQIEDESSNTGIELNRLKQDTQEWCSSERSKIQTEWKRLDKLREKMSVLWPCDKDDILKINCCGTFFELPKAALCNIEGSYLNHMFSDAFVQNIPLDRNGYYFLDFNPFCFDIIVKYLITLQARPESAVPPVPPEQQQSMDLLVESLKLKPFLRMNALAARHSTSLRVSDDAVVEATHAGWQVLSAERPLPMSGASYFEVTVLANPDQKKGGLAIGVCGHIPTGQEIHSIRFPHAIFYSSHNGLVGEDVAVENVAKGAQIVEGSVFGIRHDVHNRTLQWYHNRVLLGSCSFKLESLERMRVLYPVFALYTPGQKIQVDFSATSPAHLRKPKSAAPPALTG